MNAEKRPMQPGSQTESFVESDSSAGKEPTSDRRAFIVGMFTAGLATMLPGGNAEATDKSGLASAEVYTLSVLLRHAQSARTYAYEQVPQGQLDGAAVLDAAATRLENLIAKVQQSEKLTESESYAGSVLRRIGYSVGREAGFSSEEAKKNVVANFRAGAERVRALLSKIEEGRSKN